MMTSKLAINGGKPVISSSFPLYRSVKNEEREAINRVLDSGSLSGFYGSWGPEFLGGREVKALEEEWSDKFNVAHSVTVNSATSGLIAALGAVGLSPGDEVIVPPLTMSATVMAPLFYGGIPVFVDVEEDTFCLDVEKVKLAINTKTKAIIAVNLFGHPAELHKLAELAKSHNIAFIEDNAQAPLAKENGEYTGTIGDIGVFSLNYHKHIHSGEGGVCVTENDDLALRMQAIRNHAENITKHNVIEDLVNMVGFNFRMTEMSAAVARAQLAKVESEVHSRQFLSEKLSNGIGPLPGITFPKTRKNCEHAFYLWAIKFNEEKIGVTRDVFSRALAAEGFPHFCGYVEPLYNLPLFKKRIAIGRDHWPFSLTERVYEKNSCPLAEKLYHHSLLCVESCAYELDNLLIESLCNAFQKVYENRFELQSIKESEHA